MMLSISSCAIYHSCNLIWQHIHLIILTIFLFGCLLVLRALFIFWIQALCQINDMQIFHFVFHSFKTIFCRAEAQLLLLWIALFCVIPDTFLPSSKLLFSFQLTLEVAQLHMLPSAVLLEAVINSCFKVTENILSLDGWLQGFKRKARECANIAVATFGNYHLPKCKNDD